MKRFFIKLLLFLAIIVAIDVGYGLFCRHARSRVAKGMTSLDRHAAEETTADILIFGSSRARRHYDTQIIADSLGASVFNCGYNSMGIEFFYPRLHHILSRYTPKMIIYDVTPLFDFYQSQSIPVTIKRLRPYFTDSLTYHHIRKLNPTEWVKLHAASYRYHGEPAVYAQDDKSKERFIHGYAPLNGTQGPKAAIHNPVEVDSAKIQLFDKFIRECKQRGIRLFLVLSPYYKNDMGYQREPVERLARKHEIPLCDHFVDPAFTDSASLYWDASHLNSVGTARFTRLLLPYLH